MKTVKRTVIFTVIVLACAGIYGALRNLPVVSGCAFYNECPQALDVGQATEDGVFAMPLNVSANTSMSALVSTSVDAAAP